MLFRVMDDVKETTARVAAGCARTVAAFVVKSCTLQYSAEGRTAPGRAGAFRFPEGSRKQRPAFSLFLFPSFCPLDRRASPGFEQGRNS